MHSTTINSPRLEQISKKPDRSYLHLANEKKALFMLVAAFLLVIIYPSRSSAQKLPLELIPPDVILGGQTSTSSIKTTNSGSAPGLPGGESASQGGIPGNPRLPASGIGGAGQSPFPPPSGSGNQPAPPPAGQSGNLYSGFPGPGQAGQTAQSQHSQNNQNQKSDPLVLIETNKGPITIRLFSQYAPQTVEAFTDMVNKGFYNGKLWHRVEPGFVIQGGCPQGNGSGLYIDPATNKPRMLMLETSPNVKHNAAGVVAMARFPKNQHSASCQFYITLAPQPKLDFQYTVFGGVISGLDVVQKIQKGDSMISVRMLKQ